MIEEQQKILKFMTEMKARTDMNEFAQRVGLPTSQIVQDMQDLAKQGYLKRVGNGFAVTEKGRNSLKSTRLLPENFSFQFYLGVGQPTILLARSVKEFRDKLLVVNSVSLEFHLYRGDFENWFRTAVEDAAFASYLAGIREKNLTGEELRKVLVQAVDDKFTF